MNQEQTIQTVDIAVTCNGHLLLIRRTKAPFEDKLVLPGGHVELGESAVEAIIREALEEIGLVVRAEELRFLIRLDREHRDPRPGRRISLVYHLEISASRLSECAAASDAREIVIREISSLNESEIGFDHFEAVRLLQ